MEPILFKGDDDVRSGKKAQARHWRIREVLTVRDKNKHANNWSINTYACAEWILHVIPFFNFITSLTKRGGKFISVMLKEQFLCW